MNEIVTSVQFSASQMLPIALPQTEIRAARSIVVSEMELGVGQRLVIRVLTMWVARLPIADPPRISTSFGAVYLGVYRGQDDVARPSGMPLILLSASEVGFTHFVAPVEVALSLPGRYSILVVNNTEPEIGCPIQVVVSGAARVSG